MLQQISCRTISEQTSSLDGETGERVLVDRVWPDGVSRSDAFLDAWSSTIAPSRELRAWYGRLPREFEEFRRRSVTGLSDLDYRHAADLPRAMADLGHLTLPTAAPDTDHSHVAVLAEWLTSSDGDGALQGVVLVGGGGRHLRVARRRLGLEHLGHLPVLLVLLGAVVPAGQREDQRIAALQLAEPTDRAGVVGQGEVREDPARNDVGTPGVSHLSSSARSPRHGRGARRVRRGPAPRPRRLGRSGGAGR
ncbi:DUF488 domain-containing protein [Streptomyces sp. NPDC057403]|uniref:DUF488 domain-containing protein n=1 Tax=Streptomyces sp. NPDC057403 TaxID=3346119 RepID=UPI0036D0BFF7